MMKKVLAIALTLTMVTALFGCGTSAPAETTTQEEGAQEATTQEEGTEEATTQEEGTEVAAGDVVIGASWQDLKNEYIKGLADSAESYAKENGINLISNDGAGDTETQLSQIETFISQGVDAIIFNPYDSDGGVPAAQKARDAGIPVILVCSVLSDMSSVDTFVGSNDVTAGEMEAKLIAETIGGKGNVVILRGPNGHSAEVNRSEGIFNVLEEYPDIEVVFDQTANWDRAEAMGLMENWIQTGTEIHGVISENDEMAVGAYNALAAANKGDIPVVGIDGIADAYRSISEGGMIATFLQDNVAQAETAVDVAIKAANGETIDELYDIPFTLVDKDNVADFMK